MEGSQMRMCRSIIAVIFSALMLLSSVGPAHALVLCMKKSGNLAVRDVCKQQETQLDPASVGLQGPQGPPGPEGPAGLIGDVATAYVRTASQYIGAGSGECMEQGCDTPTDFLVSCAGGEDISGPVTSLFKGVTRTTDNTCRACAVNTPDWVTVSAVCLSPPPAGP
jgi:hypothetical protein